ncbi:DUF7338 family protein [Aminobacter ciceronei]|uniref:Uncharacterized protein n=1 Tax=Aminobacter ciceronei TaxID=150723 RepID=A0ABR6C760_9HYPH|nr:hypothetical protein [Aminobacter ciceronei]MBA8906792.1 hypothetical protein [Aminobacter ciceronei]MBA9020571.1 hypothetical protein [Aminobacter ciceronei]
MYSRYLLMAPLSLAFNLFVMATVPVWAAWAALASLDRLPGVFAYVHTHDDDIYGPVLKPLSALERFKVACWWLWRNPGYGFDAYVLGFDAAGVQIVSDSGVVDFDRGKTVSRLVVMQAANGHRYFSYRRDQMLPGNRFAKIWIGWHWSALDGHRHMIKIMFNPFRSVS